MSETAFISDTIRHRTTNPYEAWFGYSRGIRKGPFIFISGTTSTATPPLLSRSSNAATERRSQFEELAPTILYPESAYAQAKHVFETIISSVEKLGGKREDITRVRMFVADERDSEDVGKALKESLGHAAPAATMILGMRFVNPLMKVEIEADAVVL